MKRDARIGLAVVLIVGLAITLLVARSIHQHGTQAGIDQDPAPQLETASANDTEPIETAATLDPASDAQAKAVMVFQTQHDYTPGPIPEVAGTSPAGTGIDVPAYPTGGTQRPTGTNRVIASGTMPIATGGTGMLPPVGLPPIPVAPGGQPLQSPAANTLGTYTIAAGDNPWKIADKVFGNGKFAQKIMDANPGLNPSKLRVGQKVNIPAIPNATPRISLENAAGSTTTNQLIPVNGTGMTQDFPTGIGPVPPVAGGTPGPVPPSAQTHVVQTGDTLGKIAAKYLGSSGPKTVKKLQDANPGLDANRLKVGQLLKVPTP